MVASILMLLHTRLKKMDGRDMEIGLRGAERGREAMLLRMRSIPFPVFRGDRPLQRDCSLPLTTSIDG
ncbi:MAG: hypothetical protein QOH35_5011 [Acidobacteriaceae bacterium]|nr:hypothetical protein [Acidobacteriaceae bacterium]